MDTLRTPAPLSRKRSRLDLELDDYTNLKTDDALKKTRTQCELDDLDVVPAADAAWRIDVDAMLGGHTLPRYVKGRSTLVVCTRGNMALHVELLRAALPDLHALAPTLQPLILCAGTPPADATAPTTALPHIRAVSPSVNHFVRLGLLHPLGGGTIPLDALTVLDRFGRRRLVLPFGWGAGKHADTPAGRNVQVQLMGLLRHCVEVLEREAAG